MPVIRNPVQVTGVEVSDQLFDLISMNLIIARLSMVPILSIYTRQPPKA